MPVKRIDNPWTTSQQKLFKLGMCKKERKPNRECKKPSKLKVFQRAHTY
jgi:hypothetical protein